MTLLVAWLVFPLVLGLLCLGSGLLLEQAAGRELPGPLLLPAGFVVISLATQFAILGNATARLATPAVVLMAVAGLALALLRRRWRRLERPAVAAAAGVYAVYAAPVVLSGRATFAGYIKLDDTATYLAMLDRAMAHGYNVAGLAPSTYEATLKTSLAYGYPLGSLLPLGVGRPLVGTDLAWLWQPYLAFLAALLALGLYQLAARLVRSAWLRALVAFGGAQAALLYGYAFWGGVKELATAVVIVLGAALLPAAVERSGPRTILPLAAASAALLGILSVGGAVWLLPLLAAGVLIASLSTGMRRTLMLSLSFVAAAAVLAIPSFVAAVTWLSHTHAFTGGSEYGNLTRRLSVTQAFGIWPHGDFRAPAGNLEAITDVLVAAVAVAAAAALVLAWRRRSWDLPAAVAAAIFGCVLYGSLASPWVGGKALASASPVVLAAALCGGAAVFERGRRLVGGLVAAVLVAGVLSSNVLQYREVDLAPSGILSELETIGQRYAGEGPTLLTDYQPYGARHFLRNMDAEAAAELRVRLDPLRTGDVAPAGVSIDIDELRLRAVLDYRTLVLRRSALASRPPSVYRLVSAGRYYEVWQRPAVPRLILEHLSLGSRLLPAAVPRCSDVLRLARVAAAKGALLATVVRPATIVIEPDGTIGPPTSFGTYGEDRAALYLIRRYTLQASFTAPTDGDYGAWVGGTFKARLDVLIDGSRVGSVRNVLDWPGTFVPAGTLQLAAGTHSLTVRYEGPDLRPGSAGLPEFGLASVALGIGTADRPVSYVRPAAARSLCGKRLDWVEAVAH